MIQAVCFTNLDGYEREVWPTSFPVAPRRGDRVESASGKVLIVMGITWKANENKNAYMRVELHKLF